VDHRMLIPEILRAFLEADRVRRADSRAARQPRSAESLKCTACTLQASEEKSDGRDYIHGETSAGVAGAN
jgi:hypothetical protein